MTTFATRVRGGVLAATLSLTLATTLALAGCGKADEAIRDIESLKKDACACKDAQCVNDVQQRYDKYRKTYADARGTQAQADRIRKAAADMNDCLQKVGNPDEPSSDAAKPAPSK